MTPAEITRKLDELVWEIAYLGEVSQEDARRLRAAAHRLADAADTMFVPAATRIAALTSLLLSLAGFVRASPLERGRAADDLIRLATDVLTVEKGLAMTETGLSATELADEYDKPVDEVRAAMRKAD
ncbi:hypothetical protein [Actinoplanes sp. NBRC 103695]|uniref:hypothetical protein n=1 Tax=Actinoplanes sp. NBRC 103695 TaxID=3032202 RepID=UPI0024A0391F|nr:hypothetical protein [Actinoplanes sp. NBRC 103695]GLZ01604.1 hypothetical protein Acsp02_88550 [Actinoplanes sp. NBRC 103695]